MNKKAWTIRPNPSPNPDGDNRKQEFLDGNMIAIGWSDYECLSNYKDLQSIKNLLSEDGYYSNTRRRGQAAGNMNRFLNIASKGDYVVMADGPFVYIGKILSDYVCKRNPAKGNKVDENNYPHQREVQWLEDKKPVLRESLTDELRKKLKSQLTICSTVYDDIQDILDNKKYLFQDGSDLNVDRVAYLKRLRSAMHEQSYHATFISALSKLCSLYFPGVENPDNVHSESNDIELVASLPANINITIYILAENLCPEQGIQPDAVNKIGDKLEPGDQGVIVTLSDISQEAMEAADTTAKDTRKRISFIHGSELVDMILSNLDNLSSQDLVALMLKRSIRISE